LDLSQAYRARHIFAGAIPIDRRGLVKVMRAQKARIKIDPAEREVYEVAMQSSTRGRRAMQVTAL